MQYTFIKPCFITIHVTYDNKQGNTGQGKKGSKNSICTYGANRWCTVHIGSIYSIFANSI